MADTLQIAGKEFHSRLFLGTGKFASAQQMREAVDASATQMVKVALRRVDVKNPQDSILSALDAQRCVILPNTAGAYDASEAVRLARLAKASGVSDWVKLEVTPDPYHLMPDPIETLKAAEILVKEGFTVLPYIHADPILAKRLEDVGVATVMPLAAPIGTNRGLLTREMIAIIIEQANVPVVVDAGLGTPSDAAAALEMGASAVLVNTAIAAAHNPVAMAEAFRWGVEAGRTAYLAGKALKQQRAQASSPLTGFLR